ncbi:hypothetical protein LIER_13249 [Lithospermum erythrorhizon]|uniref:Uncharacterized protein n=1 Tax=Lithospermum erythrorhizon TaxID=34254 RepID=A0AAV3PV69_LITER
MSQSSENQPENFELRPRGTANQSDQACTPTPASPSANPLSSTVPESAKDEAARVEKAYQARAKRNILAGTRLNRVKDNRLHKKCFYARGGMTEAVPRIWTLKEEARGFPIPSATNID